MFSESASIETCLYNKCLNKSVGTQIPNNWTRTWLKEEKKVHITRIFLHTHHLSELFVPSWLFRNLKMCSGYVLSFYAYLLTFGVACWGYGSKIISISFLQWLTILRTYCCRAKPCCTAIVTWNNYFKTIKKRKLTIPWTHHASICRTLRKFTKRKAGEGGLISV